MHAALIWHVKTSLLDYVKAAEGGAIVRDGVDPGEAGFAFPIVELRGEPGVGSGSLRCSGMLRLVGHFGTTVQEIEAPRIDWSPSGALLSIPEHSGSARIVDAWELTGLRPTSDGWTVDGVRLTTAGAALFGGNYPAGTEFEPIHIESDQE